VGGLAEIDDSVGRQLQPVSVGVRVAGITEQVTCGRGGAVDVVVFGAQGGLVPQLPPAGRSTQQVGGADAVPAGGGDPCEAFQGGGPGARAPAASSRSAAW